MSILNLKIGLVMFLVVLMGCASYGGAGSYKIRSDGHEWVAIPGDMPNGETFVIMVPEQDAGFLGETDVTKATQVYLTEQRLSCTADTTTRRLDPRGWVVKLNCPSNDR